MDTINNKQMNFVKEYLLNVCNFSDNICDNIVARFNKMNKNIYNSVYLDDNKKYQVLFEIIDNGINVNSKVTTEYFYDDGEEWFKEEYVDERQDSFIVEESMLHHIYNKKKTALFIQEHGACREGITEAKNESFYLLTDDFSFGNIKLSALQKVKKQVFNNS